MNATIRQAMPITAKATPTPRAALEPEDRPDEDSPALVSGGFVGDDDWELEDPLGIAEGEAVPDSDTDGDNGEDEEGCAEVEEEDGDDDEDEEVRGAKFQPLICTPTTCVEPRTVLVSDQGPESVRV